MRALCFCHWAGPATFAHRQPYLPDPIPAIPNCVRLLQVNPCPMPSWPRCQLGGRQRRHRHDPSAVEVRNLGSPCSRPPARPLQSTDSLSWPSAAAIPSSHRGATDDCVTSLPARHLPSLSGSGRHCRSTSNEASTPSPVGLLVWLLRVSPAQCPLHVSTTGSHRPARPGQARHTSPS